MRLDDHLVSAARELLETRFPGAEGISAAMYTEDGTVLTSVFFEPEWGGGGLCAETGAMCEAEKLGKNVTASVCLSRLSGDQPIVVLTPCGICQERLFHWGGLGRGGGARCREIPAGWEARTLAEVQPYYWVNAFKRP